MNDRADILMITYRSSGYLHLSLPRLLETLREGDRVWLWHNGDDEATLEALRSYRDDPRVHRFHHSRENVALREPTNWLWQESTAQYVSKVDDDCRVAPGWLDTFADAHRANANFGVIGSWRHPESDFLPELALRKVATYAGGHRLMRNLWVQGSGYLMPRALAGRHGGLRQEESFTGFCIRLARSGTVNGFSFPFVPEDHMDDPRSPHTLIRSDADLLDRQPLSARASGVTSVSAWTAQLERSARVLQAASLDPRAYTGWRRRLTSARHHAGRLVGRPR